MTGPTYVHRDVHQGNAVWRTVASIWAWLALGVLVIVWVPIVAVVWLVTAPFDKGRYWPGYVFRRVAVAHQMVNPLWKFRTEGEFPVDPRHPYVVVSNHESFVDMILISHLKWEMKWLSKIEIYRIPFLGWMMRMAGDIPLRRGEKSSIADAMLQMADRLDKRVSVMIFPEGTRTPTGELGQFKDGAFRLAIDKQLPILPLAVDGTRTALHKNDWRFGVSNAVVRVLPPIATEGMTADDVGALRERTRDLIAAELASIRGQSAGSAS